MMSNGHSAEIEDRALVERYVAGRLTGAEREEFERHLIGCVTCQEGVRLGAVIRGESRDVVRGATRRPRPPLRWVWGSLLAAAAVVFMAMGIHARNVTRLRALGDVVLAPPYGGIAVRSAVTGPDSLFEQGMQRYAAGDLAAARALLTRAREAGVDSVPTSFFIGISSLLSDDASSAIREFATVVALGDTPYAAEAHYYAAKAWLRSANAERAQRELRAATADGGGLIGAAARALSDSVAGIVGR